MKPFCKYTEGLKVINYFREKSLKQRCLIGSWMHFYHIAFSPFSQRLMTKMFFAVFSCLSFRQALFHLISTEVYWEPCQVSKMERFAKIVNGWRQLTVSKKRPILNVWQGSEQAFGLGGLSKFSVLMKQILTTITLFHTFPNNWRLTNTL